jgi:hypothetical protein
LTSRNRWLAQSVGYLNNLGQGNFIRHPCSVPKLKIYAARRLVGQVGSYFSERISTASGIRSSSRNSDKSAYSPACCLAFITRVDWNIEKKLPESPLPHRPNSLGRAILYTADSRYPPSSPTVRNLGPPKYWVTVPIFVGCPEGGSPDAKSTNSNADGFVLWPLQHARRASGSSEWLGRRLGGKGDLAARNDLLSASLSSSSLSSLSSLSLVTSTAL